MLDEVKEVVLDSGSTTTHLTSHNCENWEPISVTIMLAKKHQMMEAKFKCSGPGTGPEGGKKFPDGRATPESQILNMWALCCPGESGPGHRCSGLRLSALQAAIERKSRAAFYESLYSSQAQ